VATSGKGTGNDRSRDRSTQADAHRRCRPSRESGELLGERTVTARTKGHGELLVWARKLDDERVFAVEDRRHVSGSLERFLLARASLREPRLPVAFLAGAEREIKLLLDHREDLVSERSRIQQRLRWHLHDLDPDFKIPAAALDRHCWLERIDAHLAGRAPSVQIGICCELVLRCRELTRRAKELERELAPLVAARRRRRCSQCAAAACSAPLEASSGARHRRRLNRFGNRQLNCALHRIAVTQGRWHKPARAYLARKEAERKSRREARRCLKRHPARTVYVMLKQLPEARMHDVERPVQIPALT
jgi:transposase